MLFGYSWDVWVGLNIIILLFLWAFLFGPIARWLEAVDSRSIERGAESHNNERLRIVRLGLYNLARRRGLPVDDKILEMEKIQLSVDILTDLLRLHGRQGRLLDREERAIWAEAYGHSKKAP